MIGETRIIPILLGCPALLAATPPFRSLSVPQIPNFFLVGHLDKMLVVAGIVALVPFLFFTGACIPYMNTSNLVEYNVSSFDNFADMLQVGETRDGRGALAS